MAVPFHFFYEEPQNHLALKEYIYKIGTFHYHWHRDLELSLTCWEMQSMMRWRQVAAAMHPR